MKILKENIIKKMKLIISIFSILVVHSTLSQEKKRNRWGLKLDRPEICCSNIKYKGPFSSTIECCHNLIFDLKTERCCNGTIIRVGRKLKESEECCGNYIINPEKTWCCGSKPFPKQPLQACCGDQLYSALSHVCCHGVILPFPQYTAWNCCNTVTYDTSSQICVKGQTINIPLGTKPYQCGNQLINYYAYLCCNNQPVLRLNKFTLCCEHQSYQSDQQICCQNRIYNDDKMAYYECCGLQLININTQKCCNEVPVPIPVTDDCENFNCCGTQLYDTEKATCCNGVLYSNKKINSSCCSQNIYNVNTQICCKETVYNKGISNITEDNCCEGIIYNPAQQVCCAKSLYLLNQVPPNICCSDLRSYNVYNFKKKSS